MKKRFFFFLIAFFLFQSGFPQDIKYARSIIDSLTSTRMHGRGYVNNGVNTAAEFIKKEFQKDRLLSFDSSYFQPFSYPINAIVGKTIVTIDKKTLIPGVDYLINSFSKGIKGTYKVVWFTKKIIEDPDALDKFKKRNYSKTIIIVDKTGIDDKKTKELFDALQFVNVFNAKAVVIFSGDKLTWSVSMAEKAADFGSIDIAGKCLDKKIKKITLDYKNEFIADFKTKNVIGYIKGKVKPDSFIVFSAHYDHLGQMGDDAYFPGANDNASGTSMVLDLARYYSLPENQPDYSIAFMTFTGEEVGILGSTYYTEHPLFPLSKIKMELNLDMVGTGDDGIMVVNGAVYEKEYNLLVKINDEKKYVAKVGKRGEAANSDHHPFYKKGVESFFIYTLGGTSEYHNIYDIAKTLPLTKYENVFKLMTDFVCTIK
jgi:aminopeptidase YwaD